MKKPQFEFEFSSLVIKGRSSMGNIVTRHAVFRVVLKESGVSTLGGRGIWFDSAVQRLNADERGIYLGEFSGDDRIVAITQTGTFKIHSYDLSTYFEPGVVLIEKYDPEKIYTAVYYEGEQQFYYVKRFQIEPTEKLVRFVGDHPDSRLLTISAHPNPQIKIVYSGRKKGVEEIVDLEDFIAVKGYKARGKRLTTTKIESITLIAPEVEEEEDTTNGEEMAADVDVIGVKEDAEEDDNGEQRSLFPIE
jgi:topoisomerase-4 subunit A